jgi:hypothetical protein
MYFVHPCEIGRDKTNRTMAGLTTESIIIINVKMLLKSFNNEAVFVSINRTIRLLLDFINPLAYN